MFPDSENNKEMKPFSIIILIFFSNPLSGQKDLNKLSVNPIQLFGYNRLNLEFERGFSEGKIGFAIWEAQVMP